MKTRVFIIDDHPLLREGLKQLIAGEASLLVCGEAEGPKMILTLLKESAPDVALLDISLSGVSGIDLLEQIKRHFPALKVLILSLHDETVFVKRALMAGASGYLLKDEAPEKAVLAIQSVSEGHLYLSESVASRLHHFIRRDLTFTTHHFSPSEHIYDAALPPFQMEPA